MLPRVVVAGWAGDVDMVWCCNRCVVFLFIQGTLNCEGPAEGEESGCRSCSVK